MTRRTTWIGLALLATGLAAVGAQTATTSPAGKNNPAAQSAPKKTPPGPSKPVSSPASVPSAAPSVLLNRGVIVLDAAHGGTDSGSRLTDSLVEKDVTLGLAFKLRSLLAARGFTVVMTRDSESAQPDANAPQATLAMDDRAGIANHAHAVACLLLHATGSGHGVHLYSSELEPVYMQSAATPWLTAQALWVIQSQRLEKAFGSALKRSEINLVMSRASVRPLDSLACPALVVELAPSDDDAESVNDGAYQQKVAAALSGALLNWKNDAQAPDFTPFVAPEVKP